MKPWRIVTTSGTSGEIKAFRASYLEAIYALITQMIGARRHKLPLHGCHWCAILFKRTSSYVRAKLMDKLLRAVGIEYSVVRADPPEHMKKEIKKIKCDAIIAPVLAVYPVINMLKSGELKVGDNISEDAIFVLGSSYPPGVLVSDIIELFQSPRIISLFGLAEVGQLASMEIYPNKEDSFAVINPFVNVKVKSRNKTYRLEEQRVGFLTLYYRSIFYSLKDYTTGDVIKGVGKKRFKWLGRYDYPKQNFASYLGDSLYPTYYIKVGDVELFQRELLERIPCKFFAVGRLGDKPRIEIHIDPDCNKDFSLKEFEYEFRGYVDFEIIRDPRVPQLWSKYKKPPVVFVEANPDMFDFLKHTKE